jgi:hypothetical protein
MATEADKRINSYWERWGVWVAVALLSVCAYTFQEQKARIDRLEANVQQLYMEKASKEDMKEFESRVSKQVEGIKSDILDRLDFYFTNHKADKKSAK